jgi:murein DD-endopeptidase MepM/ murein hydrolase activator NlpD
MAASSGPPVELRPGERELDVHYAGGRRRPAVTVAVPVPGAVTVEVLDGSGEVVRRITEIATPGTLEVTWDGETRDGPARTGTYAMRVKGADEAPVPFRLVDHVFPIRGRHDLGRSPTNGFGGARGHDGHDMFAACGTPLVAARGGRVREVAYDSGGGHHIVIRSRETGLDYVYMHLHSAPRAEEGDLVATGERIGEVGRSGNASGCHLHFELWHEPGWYAGGSAFDPLPRLRAWDARS